MHTSSMLTLSESAFAYLVGAEKLAIGGNFTRRAFYLAVVGLAITMVSKQTAYCVGHCIGFVSKRV